MALQVLPGLSVAGKRKHPGDTGDSIANKRLRDDPNPPNSSTPPPSLSSQPLQSLIAELGPKYDIKTLSVLSSTSITKRVDSVLRHLGRISAWDSTVLPGVVILYARSTSTNKLITIVETVRRRIHETEQKWYQYNQLYEMEWPATQHSQSHSRPPNHKVETRVEDTLMAMDDGKDSGGYGDDDDDDDDDFEVMQTQQQTVFERAVHGEEKVRQMVHMSIFLSRIPIPELKARENFAMQSNEEYVNRMLREKFSQA